MKQKALWVVAGFLFVGLLPLPYLYYGWLRVIVTATAAYFAWLRREEIKSIDYWGWVLIVIAVLFNPLLPVHLDKGLWIFIDFFTGLIFLNYAYVNRVSFRK